MGLFFDVLNAINNPQQQASVEELGTVTNEVEEIGQRYGLDKSATQLVISVIGNQLRRSLQQQSYSTDTPLDIGGLISQIVKGNANLADIQALLPPQVKNQLIQEIKERIGLSSGNSEKLVYSLLPTLLKLLNLGAPSSGASSTNPLITKFLDGDQYGDVDLGDVFKLAGNFLNTPSK